MPIGATFRVLDEIPVVLAQVIQRLEREPFDSEPWRLHHRVENIAALMRGFLEQRAAVSAGAGYTKVLAR